MTWTDDAAVTVERRDRVGVVTMSRSEVGNAVGPPQMKRLCQALDEVMNDSEIGAIILTHRGRHFMAGADFSFLDELSTMSVAAIRTDIYTWFQGAAKRLHLTSKPTVAAIGGAAITVGCELAIACDFRIATAKAVFQESWINLGLIPPLGGAKLLPQIVGWSKAKDMILRGTAVRGEEAARIGLVDELVEEEALEARALALAAELANQPPLAYQAAKEGLWQGLQSSFEDVWTAGVLGQSLLLKSEDHTEAFSAIKARRPPQFTGR